jgi:hypothetical protein
LLVDFLANNKVLLVVKRDVAGLNRIIQTGKQTCSKPNLKSLRWFRTIKCCFFRIYNAKEIIHGSHSLKETLTWEHYYRTNFIPNAQER